MTLITSKGDSNKPARNQPSNGRNTNRAVQQVVVFFWNPNFKFKWELAQGSFCILNSQTGHRQMFTVRDKIWWNNRWDRETPCHPWDIYEAPIKVQPNWTKVVASPTALSGKWWVSLNDSMTLLQSQKDWSISPSQQHLFGLRLLED